ncbi:MAG: LpxI family protein [Boseongicola sp.]
MLALISGRGKLPAVLVDSLDELPFIASLDGFDPDFLIPDMRFQLEHLGTLIADLKEIGITEVCFAGSIERPTINPEKIDAATMPLAPRMKSALEAGDDGALKAALMIFEEAGFTIRAADEIAPSLLPRSGEYTARRVDDAHRADAQRAAEIAAGLGALDVGQSCAVHKGQTLAIEGQFGTDWMLMSLERRPDEHGGIFFKAKKPGQDRRIDLPVIGVETVVNVAKAGLEGLVVECDGVMVLDLAAVTRAADDLELFLWVREG